MSNHFTLHELLDKINKEEFVALDLGCGPNPQDGCIGIDALPLNGVDYVANLEEGLIFLPNQCVNKVTSVHFLEHVTNFEFLVREIHRVLKVGGIHEVTVPYFANPHFYSDYTHKRFFGLYTFDYFSVENSSKPLKRKVPTFYTDIRFDVINRKIVFKDGERPVFNLIKKHIFTRLINSHRAIQEFYEAYLTGLLAASEITYQMKRN